MSRFEKRPFKINIVGKSNSKLICILKFKENSNLTRDHTNQDYILTLNNRAKIKTLLD